MGAAFEQFAERGIEPVTLRVIAGHAGVGTGEITKRFGSKPGLVAEVDQHARQLCVQALDRVVGSLDEIVVGTVATLVISQRFSEFLREQPTLRRYLARRLSSDSAAGRLFFEQVVGLVDDGLRQLRRAGLIQPDLEHEGARRMVVGMILSPVLLADQWEHLLGVDPFDPSVAEPHEHVVHTVLARGLFAEPAGG